jgi:hypothetical protein
MKRKETETFKEYKQRRLKDKIVTEMILTGTCRNSPKSNSIYVAENYYKVKYQRTMKKT